jgi:hypothetical protein
VRGFKPAYVGVQPFFLGVLNLVLTVRTFMPCNITLQATGWIWPRPGAAVITLTLTLTSNPDPNPDSYLNLCPNPAPAPALDPYHAGYWMDSATAGCGSAGFNDWSGPAGAYCCHKHTIRIPHLPSAPAVPTRTIPHRSITPVPHFAPTPAQPQTTPRRVMLWWALPGLGATEPPTGCAPWMMLRLGLG